MEEIKPPLSRNLQELPQIYQIDSKGSSFMAGKGFMHKSTTCLILKPTNQHKALLLSIWKHYTNCFAVSPQGYQLLFTYTEQTPDIVNHLKKAHFITQTVNEDSKVIIESSTGRYLGLKVDLASKKVKFQLKKVSPAENCLKDLSLVEDLQAIHPVKGLSSLCIGATKNKQLALFINRGNELRQVFKFTNQIVNLEKVTFITTKFEEVNSSKQTTFLRYCHVVVSTVSEILIFKLCLKPKKVLKRTEVMLNRLARPPYSSFFHSMVFPPRLTTSPIYDPKEDSLIFILSSVMGSNLFKIKRVSRKHDQRLITSKGSFYTTLLNFWPGMLIMGKPMSGMTDMLFDKCALLDKDDLGVTPLEEGPNMMLDFVRDFEHSGNPEIKIDELNTENLIFRTPQKGFIIEKGNAKFLEKIQKEDEKDDVFAGFQRDLVHCHSLSSTNKLSISGDLILSKQSMDNFFDLFKMTRNGPSLIRRVSASIDLKQLEKGKKLFDQVKYLKELQNGDIVLIIGLVVIGTYSATQRSFGMLKICGKTARILKFEELKFIGMVLPSEMTVTVKLDIEELGDHGLVAYMMDMEKVHIFIIDLNNLSISEYDYQTKKDCDILIYEKEEKFEKSTFSQDLMNSLSDLKLSWLHLRVLNIGHEAYRHKIEARKYLGKKKFLVDSDPDSDILVLRFNNGSGGFDEVKLANAQVKTDQPVLQSEHFYLFKVRRDDGEEILGGSQYYFILVNSETRGLYSIDADRFGGKKVNWMHLSLLEDGGYEICLFDFDSVFHYLTVI